MADPKHWYVYHLVDPRDCKPFYVGKGTGHRIRAHETDARRGITSPKCNKIREIWEDDLPVERRVVKIFEIEQEAYRFEAREIARIGIENLTNLADGQGLERSQKLLKGASLMEDGISRLAWLLKATNGLTREIQMTWSGPYADMRNMFDKVTRDLGGYVQFGKRILELFVSAWGREEVTKRLSAYGIALVEPSTP